MTSGLERSQRRRYRLSSPEVKKGGTSRFFLFRAQETGELGPKEAFAKSSKIALLVAYDLIDKIRYWEKETMELPDEEIVRRVDHMAAFIERLRDAYLGFGELEDGPEDD